MANKPNNPSLWSKAKSLAKQKFDVYPSAYANGWAAKWYKGHGGTWRKAEYGMEVLPEYQTRGNVSSSADDIEKQKNFMLQWNRSPMGSAMRNASVDKDNPTGLNFYYSNALANARESLIKNANVFPEKYTEFSKRLDKKKAMGPNNGTAGYATGKASNFASNPNSLLGYMMHPVGYMNKLNENDNDLYSNVANFKPSKQDYNIYLHTEGKGNSYKQSLIHELSHAMDASGRFIPYSDLKKMYTYVYSNKSDEDLSDFQSYVANPTETRARLMNFRYNAANQKLYDPFNQKATKDVLLKYKDNIQTGYDPLEQLREVYTDDQILDMLNSISRAKPANTQITTAKYGGTNNSGFKALPEYVQAKILSNMAEGGEPQNAGFQALPDYVQDKIMDNMAFGGYIPQMAAGGWPQQAAIAIAMKKAGKKPKQMKEGGDPDGEMAIGQIMAMHQKLSALQKFIQPDSDLEPWVASKLTLADDYLNSVADYMQYNPEENQEMQEMGRGGYVVTRSNDRKGKTHKVTGPDGTVKYFGDSKLGQHPKDPERKAAFYARHKKNLDRNPYFRAFARATWADGGETNLPNYQVQGWVQRAANADLNFWEKCRLASSADNGRGGGGYYTTAKEAKPVSNFDYISNLDNDMWFGKDQLKEVRRSRPKDVDDKVWNALNSDARWVTNDFTNKSVWPSDKINPKTGRLDDAYLADEWRPKINISNRYRHYNNIFKDKTGPVTAQDLYNYYSAQPGGWEAYKTLVNNDYMPQKKDGGSTYYNGVWFQEGGQKDDSILENIAEVFDPTGISSWDDVYRSYKKTGFSPETALEIFGAIPLLGKAAKLSKAGIHMAKYKGLDQAIYKKLPKSKIVSNILRGAGLAGRGTDAIQAAQQSPTSPLMPDFGMYNMPFAMGGVPCYECGGMYKSGGPVKGDVLDVTQEEADYLRSQGIEFEII